MLQYPLMVFAQPVERSNTVRWEAGKPILWRSVRNGVVQAAQPMRLVRDEDGLVALYICPLTRWRRRKGRRGCPSGRQMLPDGWTGEYEDVTWHTNRALVLYRPGDSHSVGLCWRDVDGVFLNWYVNLEAPWRRTSVGFDSWDHTLDLVVAPDLGGWAWKDEDEFAWAQEVGLISPSEAEAIRSEGERVIEAIERRLSPFCGGWATWAPDPKWGPLDVPKNWNAMG